jgi:kinesin family protein 6/9
LQHVTVHIPKNESGGFINNVTENWKFKFDKIMHNSSQEDVFDYCALETVQQVANGYNGTVMCYG